MEASKSATEASKNMFSSQNGNSLGDLQRWSPGEQPGNGNFATSVAGLFAAFGQDGRGCDVEISEDHQSETRSVLKRDSVFSVPLIRVEDWSSSESDIEDDLSDSLPPFRFVGTRKKVNFFSNSF